MGCFCRKRGCSHRHQEGFRVPIPPSCSTSFSWEGKRREKSRESLLCLLETMPHRISICLGGLLETRMLCFCLWERSPVASLSDISWGRLDFFFSILVLWGKLLVSTDTQGMVKDVRMDEPGEKERLAAWNHPVFCFVSLLALHPTSLQ